MYISFGHMKKYNTLFVIIFIHFFMLYLLGYISLPHQAANLNNLSTELEKMQYIFWYFTKTRKPLQSLLKYL